MNQTVARWRGLKFVWGQHDCIIGPCNHVREKTGIDPAAPWRGTYDDEAGALRILSLHGGALNLFSFGMAAAGFKTTEAPKENDVVICRMGQHQIGGLYLGPQVAFVSLTGCLETRAPVLGAWKV